MEKEYEQRLRGLPVSPGIAIGRLRVEARDCTAPEIHPITEAELPGEWKRFEAALEHTEEELTELKKSVEAASGAAEAAIFDAHLLFLRDSTILGKLRHELPLRMQNIESVYYAVVQNFMEVMRTVDDPYLRSRVMDIRDVLQRVLRNMETGEPVKRALPPGEPCSILAAYELTPGDTADCAPIAVSMPSRKHYSMAVP